MAQLELANLLAANGAPAAPASSGAGIEGNSQASAPAISFSQWFQSNPPATPGAAALAETMAGDGARAAANPPTTPAEGIAAPPVDAGRAETLALVIGALDGTALTPSADGSGDLEEPVGESDAGESPERARDGATAELPWLGLPLVMDARAALRAQDGASADPAPETETINGAVAGFERLRSMPWPGSSSWSASGGGAGLGANGGVASEVATAVSRPETVAALAPGNAGGLPSTGLDAALQPLTDAGAIESPALKSMPSPGLQPAIISSSMPESVAANPPRLDLTLPSPASSEAPVEGEGAARDARVFS
ncbi:MAG: hypothetical protein JNK31_00405, partial [Candidatus Competibacter sp.]|nr:hypothetical protein [Candidatus Competibacter sp.]